MQHNTPLSDQEADGMLIKVKLYHETSKDTHDYVIKIFVFCVMHDTVNFMTLYSLIICSSISNLVDFIIVSSLRQCYLFQKLFL
jgi:hypothetical protein